MRRVNKAPAGCAVLGPGPGLSQSMAEAASDALAGLPAMLSRALPPEACKHDVELHHYHKYPAKAHLLSA